MDRHVHIFFCKCKKYSFFCCLFDVLCLGHKQDWALVLLFITAALWCRKVSHPKARGLLFFSALTYTSRNQKGFGAILQDEMFLLISAGETLQMVSSVLFIICCHDRHIEQSKQTQRGNTISLSVHQTEDDRAKSLCESVRVFVFFFCFLGHQGQRTETTDRRVIFYTGKASAII